MSEQPDRILLPEKTGLIKVREGSDSLKTTIPPGVRSFLDLKPSDELVWEISMDGRQKVVKVVKG